MAGTDADIIKRITETVRPRLDIRASEGDTGRIHTVTRKGGEKRLWLVVNTGAETVEVELDAGCALEEIPLDPGFPVMLERNGNRFRRVIHPFESIILRAAEKAEDTSLPPRVRIGVSRSAEVIVHHPNLLRFGMWRMALLDEKGDVLQDETVETCPIVNQLTDSGFRYAPATEQRFGDTLRLRVPHLGVRYWTSFENNFSGQVMLLMEPGSIVGDFEICVNDTGALTMGDFGPTDAHVRGTLGTDITDLLAGGPNVISVVVSTGRPDGGLVNPLYLCGDFRVDLDPVAMGERGKDGTFEDHEANGLPFYAGVIEYRTRFDLENVPASGPVMAEVDFGVPFKDACEVSVNDGTWTPVLWSPRCLMLPADSLKKQGNRLGIRVYTSLSRAFDGLPPRGGS
jgi:hypothetical protein